VNKNTVLVLEGIDNELGSIAALASRLRPSTALRLPALNLPSLRLPSLNLPNLNLAQVTQPIQSAANQVANAGNQGIKQIQELNNRTGLFSAINPLIKHGKGLLNSINPSQGQGFDQQAQQAQQGESLPSDSGQPGYAQSMINQQEDYSSPKTYNTNDYVQASVNPLASYMSSLLSGAVQTGTANQAIGMGLNTLLPGSGAIYTTAMGMYNQPIQNRRNRKAQRNSQIMNYFRNQNTTIPIPQPSSNTQRGGATATRSPIELNSIPSILNSVLSFSGAAIKKKVEPKPKTKQASSSFKAIAVSGNGQPVTTKENNEAKKFYEEFIKKALIKDKNPVVIPIPGKSVIPTKKVIPKKLSPQNQAIADIIKRMKKKKKPNKYPLPAKDKEYIPVSPPGSIIDILVPKKNNNSELSKEIDKKSKEINEINKNPMGIDFKSFDSKWLFLLGVAVVAYLVYKNRKKVSSFFSGPADRGTNDRGYNSGNRRYQYGREINFYKIS